MPGTRPWTSAVPVPAKPASLAAALAIGLSAGLAASLLTWMPAYAQPGPPPPTSAAISTTTTVVAVPSISSTTTTTIRSVRLDLADNAYLAGVSTRLRAAEAALSVARMSQRTALATLASRNVALDHAAATVAAMNAQERAAIALVESSRARLRVLAVSSYVSGGSASPINDLLASRSFDELGQRREVLAILAKTNVTAMRQYESARKNASALALKASQGLEQTQIAKQLADQVAVRASDLVSRRTVDLKDITQLLQLVTAAVGYPGTDIPRLVLDAYQRAALNVGQHGCKLSWAAVAAIGRVESNHGRSQGAQLTVTGDLVPPIIGPALDGQNGTALVPDSDNGRWDGDPVYAHAIGPMQFIESSWSSVGRDGNGDGVADPNNIYDAALGAAVYLCRAAPPDQLDTDTGLREAFHSYNHSDFYVEEVLTLTHAYASVALGT